MFFIMYEYGKCRRKVLPNPEENEMVRVIKNIQNKQEIKHPDHTDFIKNVLNHDKGHQ